MIREAFSQTRLTQRIYDRKWYDRWREAEANGAQYFSFVDGIRDSANRRVPSQRYDDWSADMFWMSAYFSGAVLASIFLSYAPGRITEEMVQEQQQESGGEIITSQV